MDKRVSDGDVLFSNEAHALDTLVYMRRREYRAAREAFLADNPRASSRLLDAAVKYITALEARDASR